MLNLTIAFDNDVVPAGKEYVPIDVLEENVCVLLM